MPEQHLTPCPNCQLPLLSDFYFCPNCGKQVRIKPITISVGRQIVLYLVSIFLPPAALPFAIRYIRQQNKKTRIVGVVILCLVIGSIAFSLYAYAIFIQQFYSMYTQLGSSRTFGY